jgi:hypothetical protein
MKVSELRAILNKLRSIYASGGAKSQAGDVERIIALLNGRDEQSVDQFVSEAKSLLARADRKPGQQVHESLVDKYANMLTQVGTNEDAFKGVLSGLKSDRNVAKPTLDAIVNRYVNTLSGGTHVFKFKSKKEALEKLRIKYLERAESESKDRIVKR